MQHNLAQGKNVVNNEAWDKLSSLMSSQGYHFNAMGHSDQCPKIEHRLGMLTQEAADEGLPYQCLIVGLLHKYFRHFSRQNH